MKIDLETATIIRAVQALLGQLGRRPAVREVAAELGLNPLTLRRAWRQTGRTSLRELIIYGCLNQAAALMADGTKVEAAMRLAGFRNWTNFNKQFKDFFGETPSQYRARHGARR